MKLSQGEYVALERVESLYSGCPIISQLYLHGDSLQSYLVALVIPDPTQLAAIASKVWSTNVSPSDLSALDRAARDPKVQQEVLRALDKMAKSVGLNGYVMTFSNRLARVDVAACRSFEMIKRIHITNDPLTVDNDCLTPTLKIKRLVSCLSCPSSSLNILRVIRKDVYNRYKQELDALYALGEPTSRPATKL